MRKGDRGTGRDTAKLDYIYSLVHELYAKENIRLHLCCNILEVLHKKHSWPPSQGTLAPSKELSFALCKKTY